MWPRVYMVWLCALCLWWIATRHGSAQPVLSLPSPNTNPPASYHVAVTCDPVPGAALYFLYAGTNGVDWPHIVSSTNRSIVISNLPSEGNLFYMTALDSFGIESDPSPHWRKTNHFSALWATNLAGPWLAGGTEIDDPKAGYGFARLMATNNWDPFKAKD